MLFLKDNLIYAKMNRKIFYVNKTGYNNPFKYTSDHARNRRYYFLCPDGCAVLSGLYITGFTLVHLGQKKAVSLGGFCDQNHCNHQHCVFCFFVLSVFSRLNSIPHINAKGSENKVGLW